MSEICNLSIDQWNDLLPQQNPIIKLNAAQYIALTDPYSNMFMGGTFDSGEGENIVSLAPTNPVLNQSLITPALQDWVLNSCGEIGPSADWGSTQFTTLPQWYSGKSPQVCVSVAYPKVEDNYTRAVDTMKMGIGELKRSDARYQMLTNSGLKFIATTSSNIGLNLAGGENDVKTPFPFGLVGYPTSYLTWKMLLSIMDYVRFQIRMVEYFPGMADGMFTFIGGPETIEILRNDGGLNSDMSDAVKGSFKDAKDARWKYAFIEYPYRGVQFGIDAQPLRYNVLDPVTGQPTYIEPRIKQATTYGFTMVANPDWMLAKYEIAILFTKDTFSWLMPKQYQGEDGMKFPAQYYSGETSWVNPLTDCNPFQNKGRFYWQITRAIQAVRPHGVIGITFQRCQSDLGGANCPNVTTVLSA